MHYFITSQENPTPSAIEIAQMQRVHLFKSFDEEAKIIEVEYNLWHDDAQRSLKSSKYVINMFQYYQKLDLKTEVSNDDELIERILHSSNYEVKDKVAYRDGKRRLQIVLRENRLYSANYYDRWGFLDRVDFYDDGCVAYSEFYEDKSRLVMRQYYDNAGKAKIMMHYRGSDDNQPVLTLIQLNESNNWRDFDTLAEFRAYFLDEICQNDTHAVLYADRSDYTLDAFRLMHEKCPRYMIFHSALTTDGQVNGEVFDIYQRIGAMLKNGSLTGLISSTDAEADDAANLFDTDHSYAIPVTFTKNNIVQVPFSERKPYSLIAVARLDAVKRLDQIINAVVKLHDKFSELTLSFYGYGDAQTEPKLRNLVKQLGAASYILFSGYKQDLTEVYNHAWLEVLTSKYEGFAMALLEAQEHGCPAVSYDINYGPSEIISNGYNVRLIQSGNEVELIEMLDFLLGNPEVIEEYSKNAYESKWKYSFDNVANAWHSFLKSEKIL
ncbi:glycosyltransferase [Lactobacillus ultunensis]|uniref:Glycosyltransferase, group 1 family protein n=1 Tax=Lactobacillus ultunensis DSM 16047 TaxID=525365 RepID=C2EMS5_9LACO|nr:glycosyltransferase [Lactobacillus ultunensis]EEJ72148.1 glycosyltransferase, group 1 family protein [Lactobacillus ultunensis DSM 16047]KRL80348.1 glycosyltransferase [Lactobacillus ultunensis DSM 16047]QQP27786.1 glycosyltransferase [Lactobacillus ultunensis]